MTIKRPSTRQLQAIADSVHMELETEEASELRSLMDGNLSIYESLDQFPDEIPKVIYPRSAGVQPEAEANPLNAWYWQTAVSYTHLTLPTKA